MSACLLEPQTTFRRQRRRKSSLPHLPGGRLADLFHPSEDAAAAPEVSAPSLAVLLSRRVLHDGELVLLMLRPSVWFIVFASLPFAAAVLILVIAAYVFAAALPYQPLFYIEVGIFVLAGRVMWAVLQWMGRLYILTNLRVLRLSGVFNVDIYDCPLRKVAEARLLRPLKERLVGVGTIVFVPRDDSCPSGAWQTIARPAQVHEQVEEAIRRSRRGGWVGW